MFVAIEELATGSTGNAELDSRIHTMQAMPPLTLTFNAGQLGATLAVAGFLNDDDAVEWLNQHSIPVPSNNAAAEAVMLDVMYNNPSDAHLVMGASIAMGIRHAFWKADEALAEEAINTVGSTGLAN